MSENNIGFYKENQNKIDCIYKHQEMKTSHHEYMPI